MVKRRLIPKLQLKARRGRPILVTTQSFATIIEVGDPVSQAKIYEAQMADELLFLDLEASIEGRLARVDVIGETAAEIFMPFTVGGGVRSLADVRLLLSSGADKVAINTAAVETPDLINAAAEKFGSQCVVLSIDYRKRDDGSYGVWTRGGRTATHWDPLAWAMEGERRGAGEILLTSIDRDGTREGLDIQLTRRVVDNVSVPVIASGGCGSAAHFVEGFLAGGADAIAAGTYFCFKDENPMQSRARILNASIPVRMQT